MANAERVFAAGMDLLRHVCDEMGRGMVKDRAPLQVVVDVARKFNPAERQVFFDSYISEAYKAGDEMFPLGDPNESKRVIKSCLEFLVMSEYGSDAAVQLGLPNF